MHATRTSSASDKALERPMRWTKADTADSGAGCRFAHVSGEKLECDEGLKMACFGGK